jgi:hypothetical protein
MASALRVCAVVLLPLLLAACTDSGTVILGPTPSDEGIVIFLHADFVGSSQALNVDVRDLTRVQGPCSSGAEGEVPSWGKCVSSVRVLPGWSATFYREEDFKGRSVTLTTDTPNLRNLPGPCDGSFNDCVTSIRVMRQ